MCHHLLEETAPKSTIEISCKTKQASAVNDSGIHGAIQEQTNLNAVNTEFFGAGQPNIREAVICKKRKVGQKRHGGFLIDEQELQSDNTRYSRTGGW